MVSFSRGTNAIGLATTKGNRRAYRSDGAMRHGRQGPGARRTNSKSMKLRIALVAMSMLTVMPLAQGHSATDYIGIADNYFDPPRWVAGTGDTVEWRTTCSYYSDDCTGAHNVTAYEGAAFASPSPIGHPGTFSVTLDSDGPIGYRCTFHSTLANGRCTGMCGVIAKDADITPPSAVITEPSNDQIVTLPGVTGAVTIAGTATDDIAVGLVQLTLYDVLGRPSAHQTTCTGCPGTSVTWQRVLDLAPGVYTAEARAFDSAGNNRTSARVRFFVL